MIIGIDVDGVLVDTGKYQLETGIPYFKKKYGMGVKNPKAYDIADIFGCCREQRESFGQFIYGNGADLGIYGIGSVRSIQAITNKTIEHWKRLLLNMYRIENKNLLHASYR